MSNEFKSLPSGIVLELPDGGPIHVTDGDVESPTRTTLTDVGCEFGPLDISPSGYLGLSDLTYLPGEGGGWISFGVAGATGLAGERTLRDDDLDSEFDAQRGDIPSQPTPTRRGVISVFGALAIAAVGTGTVAAADSDDQVTISLVEFAVSEIKAPVTVSVIDSVDNVLPTTTEVLVDQEGVRTGSISEPDEDISLRQESGEVSIYLRDSRSKLEELLAWVLGWIPRDESLTYRRTFPDGNLASDYDQGEFVRLTSHPAIVDPIRESVHESTVLKVGNTEIPHSEQGSSEAGVWSNLDDSLIYEVGPNPPASDQWSVTTKLAAWQTILD